MWINKICKALEQMDVPYAIVGGQAVVLHGFVRGTADIDFIIRWSLENLKNAEQALKDLGLVSRIPVDANDVYNFRDEYISKRNLIAWNFYDPTNPLNQVDIIINYDLRDAKIKIIKSSHGEIKILSRKELIAMKKKSGRPQDLEDIKALESL